MTFTHNNSQARADPIYEPSIAYMAHSVSVVVLNQIRACNTILPRVKERTS
jgi:hypothetical protein